ncbi:MAG: DUF1592 domain-containing protein [Vicinamibacteraceae bacterium]
MRRWYSPTRRPRPSTWVLLTAIAFVGALSGVVTIGAQRAAPAIPKPAIPKPAIQGPAALGTRFDTVVAPFVKTYCLECHSGEKPEAELDLSTLTSMTAAANEPRWGLILEMLESGEMPADDAKEQPAPHTRAQAVAWFKDLRTYEVARNAGDPGVVLARRLNNAEYNYTIRDLTGVDLQPSREFPADPSNPAGFDNSGESLTMSPSLLKKYLAASRDIANHAYLNADGIRFAPHSMLADVDADKLFVHRIIDFYHQQNTSYAAYFAAAWRHKHRAALGRPRATLADTATDAKVSAKYLATLWDVLEGPRETVGPIARVQDRWRALPAPGPKGEDTAAGGREALQNYIELLRAKIEPRFRNLVAPGVNAAQQPFMIWRNVQFATHRMTFDPAQLQVGSEPRPEPIVDPEPGNNQFGPGPTPPVVNAIGDPDLVVPAGERARYEAQFARFSRVFPDMFYMQERGRHYFDRVHDRGRYLDAGFHSLMGYFRDDQPLYELVLDTAQQQALDALWLDMDVVGNVTSRMYQQYIENQTSQGGGRGRVVMPPNPNNDLVTSEPRVKAIEAAFVVAAEGGEPRTFEAIHQYFGFINDRLRLVERLRREAEPKHLDALAAFAQRAYRRPLTPAERDDLRRHYQQARHDGLDHDAAIRESLVVILMSPDFLYRLDLLTTDSDVAPLSGYALASRLSYFLWSTLPDDELLARAAAGDLRKPGVMAAQAKRMLKDPRARALAVEFGGNWLDFRRFQDIATVDRERFPAFSNELRSAMFEEPVRLLLDVMQANRPVLDLLYATDTFVNPVLAKHYGMPPPKTSTASDGEGAGDTWTRVTNAQAYGRGGLLPMAAFLTRNAPGLRTSPVKRGNWVVKNVLGEHISPPPPTVPQLPQDEAKLDLPLRQMMERHRADPQCAACHAKFDAMGLVFEGYGPVGERRQTDLANRPVDVTVTFPGGSQGAGVAGLRDYIRAHRQRQFVDNVSGKLLAFALSRSLVLTDGPLVEDMSRTLAARGYRFDSLLERIVTSRQFLNKRGSLSTGHDPKRHDPQDSRPKESRP